MRVTSSSIVHGERVPAKNAFATPDPESHLALSDNVSPALSWDDLPEGTRSVVVVCHDPDVPSVGDDVNQEGRTVSASVPRTDFYHLVVVDLDPARGGIAEGEFSSGITPRGKEGPDHPSGGRVGINSYTGWFASDPDMSGEYHAYDGPCPPWNDEVVHHYHFTVYATDLDRVPVQGKFDTPAVLKAIEGHVLEQEEIVATYSTNPSVPA